MKAPEGVERTAGPPEERSDARAALLEAASQLMRDRDTLDISLSELSAKSALNAGLVRYYFGSKDGLLRALLERDITPGLENLRALVVIDRSPTAKIRSHIQALISFYYGFPYTNRLLMKMMREGSAQDTQALADAYVKPFTDAYEEVVRQGVNAGEFKYVDPKILYFNIIGACDTFFSARVVLRHCYGIESVREDFRRDYVRQTTDLILNGLLNNRDANETPAST